MVSTYNPEAGFNVGNAMGRNKYIYALADFAVVVSSDYRSGGTWAGGEEELRREGGRPIFVRSGPGVPKGNTELLKLKAQPFPPDALTGSLREALQRALSLQTKPAVPAEESVSFTALTLGEPEADFVSPLDPELEMGKPPIEVSPPPSVGECLRRG